jgi:hypothetical protein
MGKTAKQREYAKRAQERKLGSVSASQLLTEGVLEIGRIGSVAYARTGKGLHLFHVDAIPATGRKIESPIPEEMVISAVDVE